MAEAHQKVVAYAKNISGCSEGQCNGALYIVEPKKIVGLKQVVQCLVSGGLEGIPKPIGILLHKLLVLVVLPNHYSGYSPHANSTIADLHGNHAIM